MSGSGSGSGSHAELEMLAPGVSLTTSLKSISSSSLSSVSNVNLAAIEAYGLCVEDTKATLPPADLVDIPPCAWYRRLSDHLPPLKEFVVSPTEAVRVRSPHAHSLAIAPIREGASYLRDGS